MKASFMDLIAESMDGMAVVGMTDTVPIDCAAGPGECDEESKEFSEEDLKLAKRFVELIGSIEKARDLLDKVGECEECLDLIDDESDEDSIEQMASTMPSTPDLPGIQSVEISSLYNPSATVGLPR